VSQQGVGCGAVFHGKLRGTFKATVQACHGYFTRAAQAEAARCPNGTAALHEQLLALETFNTWLCENLCSFRRRFKHAHASLLMSLDSASINAFLEDVLYQGPLHVEVPLEQQATVLSDGSLSFSLDVPATLANRRSVLRDTLRTLLGGAAAADAKYLERSALRDGGGGKGGLVVVAEGQRSLPVEHELLVEGPDDVAVSGDKVSLGSMQVLTQHHAADVCRSLQCSAWLSESTAWQLTSGRLRQDQSLVAATLMQGMCARSLLPGRHVCLHIFGCQPASLLPAATHPQQIALTVVVWSKSRNVQLCSSPSGGA
jgi:hypothetical protein